MTLAEIASTLPQGFHDAEWLDCHIDYKAKVAVLHLDLWIGLMSQNEKERERYARTTVTLTGLQYFVIEPPQNDSSPEHGQSSVDGYIAAEHPGTPRLALPPTNPESFQYSLFVDDWNASVHLAACSAALSFDDPSDAAYVSDLMKRLAGTTLPM